MSIFSPVTAAAFDATATPVINALLSDPSWATSTPAQRAGLVDSALRGLPVIGDWLINQGGGIIQHIVDNLLLFSGPTIPDKPLSEWFGDWWFSLFGEVLHWATDPLPGAGV